MPLFPVTGFYASLLAIVFIYLSILVILNRRSRKISLGDGDDKDFQRLVRVHGNFSEYVPLALILLLIAELNSHHIALLHACGLTLLFGRLIHAYGVRCHFGVSWQRVAGMMLTFTSLILGIAANLLGLYFHF